MIIDTRKISHIVSPIKIDVPQSNYHNGQLVYSKLDNKIYMYTNDGFILCGNIIPDFATHKKYTRIKKLKSIFGSELDNLNSSSPITE